MSARAQAEAALLVRNEMQAALADASFAVDGCGEQKTVAWICRYAKTFGDLWDQNENLRNALIQRWSADPGWCLAELRRHWRGDGP
ncbi:MAG: hypothetical protein IT384_03945 [Deltaproteobacteria bacterium]|nr:hypothetical protein [Deltaproteobacteria bacterium]